MITVSPNVCNAKWPNPYIVTKNHVHTGAVSCFGFVPMDSGSTKAQDLNSICFQYWTGQAEIHSGLITFKVVIITNLEQKQKSA